MREAAPPAGDEAHVSFRARLVQKGAIKMLDLVEKSTFVREDGKWLYAAGEVQYEASPIVGEGADDA